MDNTFPNMDHKTGIHYGVINQNKIGSFVIDDIITNGEDLTYNYAKLVFENAIRDAIDSVLDDNGVRNHEEITKRIDLDEAVDAWNEDYMSDTSCYLYEDDGLKIEFDTDDGDLLVIKSPYFTYCKACAPNAGYLTDSVTKEEYEENLKSQIGICTLYSGFKKAYCLPDDWFEDEKAPYKYFEVDKND